MTSLVVGTLVSRHGDDDFAARVPSRFDSGEGNLATTRVPPSHPVRRAASSSRARRPSEPTSSSELELDLAGIGLAPAAHDPPVPPGGGPGVAVRVEQLGLVRAEVPLALEPPHRGRVQRGEERRPRLGRAVGSRSSGSTYPDLPSRSTSTAPRSAQRLPCGRDGRPEPPLDVRDRPGPERAEPSLHQSRHTLRLRERRDLLAEPGPRGRPARARGRPSAVVGCPHDVPGRGQRGQHARGHRHVPAPRLPFAEGDRALPAMGSRREAPTTWPPAHPTGPRGPARRPCRASVPRSSAVPPVPRGG